MTICRKITKFYVMTNFFFQLCFCRDLPYFPKNTTLRVYGGTPVKLGEIPYQVAFKIRYPKDPNLFYTFCGGAIIGATKILSAAHCFVGETTDFLTLCYGKTYVDDLNDKYAVAATIRNTARREESFEQWRTIRNITYPASYRFPEYDLAIVFVMDPFVFNDLVKPIRFAENYEDYEGFCLVSGYGQVSMSVKSDSLLKAHLLLLSNVWCSRIHKRDMSLFICTSPIGANIGKGDSGGPLVCTHTGVQSHEEDKFLIGIASGSYEDFHSFFVRVSAYHNYITRNHCEKISSSYFMVIIMSIQYIHFLSFDLFVFYY